MDIYNQNENWLGTNIVNICEVFYFLQLFVLFCCNAEINAFIFN